MFLICYNILLIICFSHLQISQRTRVLVLVQSRARRMFMHVLNHGLTGDAIIDWGEALFLYELQKFRKNRHSLKRSSRSAGSLVKNTSLTSSEKTQSNQSKDVNRESSDSTVNSRKIASRWKKTQLPSTFGTDDQSLLRSKIKRALNSNNQPKTKPIRDWLVPTETDQGLWWWDSSLPFNLASISECQQLQLRSGSHPLYNSREYICNDGHHAGQITGRDLITMIFNLMCNSILDTPQEFCCS